MTQSGEDLTESSYNSIYDKIADYVKRLEPQNKGEYTQKMYYIIIYLINKLRESSRSVGDLFQPRNFEDYLILKRYLIPLIDLLTEIHPDSAEYNTFCYDYLLNGEITSENIYIIENITEPTLRIVQIPGEQIDMYMKEKNICMCLAGTLFDTHEKNTGLFTELLLKLKNMRKEYKDKMTKYDKGSDMYNFYDARQTTVKIVMNTAYGLFGLSTFRYSNSWLAKSITVQGRLVLKLSQIVGEIYLNKLKDDMKNE